MRPQDRIAGRRMSVEEFERRLALTTIQYSLAYGVATEPSTPGTTSDLAMRLSLSAPAPEDLVFNLASSNVSATKTADYNDPASSTVTVPAGQSYADLHFTVLYDEITDNAEYFTATVTPVSSSGSGWLLEASGSSASGTIFDGGGSGSGSGSSTGSGSGSGSGGGSASVSFWINSSFGSEPSQSGQTGAVTFRISLGQTVAQDVTFNLSLINGSATKNSDFSDPASATLTIAAGQSYAEFNVPVLYDTNPAEGDETFNVAIDPQSWSGSGWSLNSAGSSATGTIHDGSGGGSGSSSGSGYSSGSGSSSGYSSGSGSSQPQIESFGYTRSGIAIELTGLVLDDIDPTNRTVTFSGLVTGSTTVGQNDRFIESYTLSSTAVGSITASYTDVDGHTATAQLYVF